MSDHQNVSSHLAHEDSPLTGALHQAHWPTTKNIGKNASISVVLEVIYLYIIPVLSHHINIQLGDEGTNLERHPSGLVHKSGFAQNKNFVITWKSTDKAQNSSSCKWNDHPSIPARRMTFLKVPLQGILVYHHWRYSSLIAREKA